MEICHPYDWPVSRMEGKRDNAVLGNFVLQAISKMKSLKETYLKVLVISSAQVSSHLI
jgi:hypothetical protein